MHCYFNTPPEVHCHPKEVWSVLWSASPPKCMSKTHFRLLQNSLRQVDARVFTKIREHPGHSGLSGADVLECSRTFGFGLHQRPSKTAGETSRFFSNFQNVPEPDVLERSGTFRNIPDAARCRLASPARAVTIHPPPTACPSTNSIGLCLTVPCFSRDSFNVESSIFP